MDIAIGLIFNSLFIPIWIWVFFDARDRQMPIWKWFAAFACAMNITVVSLGILLLLTSPQ